MQELNQEEQVEVRETVLCAVNDGAFYVDAQTLRYSMAAAARVGAYCPLAVTSLLSMRSMSRYALRKWGGYTGPIPAHVVTAVAAELEQAWREEAHGGIPPTYVLRVEVLRGTDHYRKARFSCNGCDVTNIVADLMRGYGVTLRETMGTPVAYLKGHGMSVLDEVKHLGDVFGVEVTQ
jgi:hypothetical protein